MNEIGKNNDPLENFFREKLEDHNIAYDERDWEKLEQRLDAAGTASQPWIKWAAAAAILLASLLGYFIYENYSAINRINDQLANEKSSVTEEQSSQELPKSKSEEQNQSKAKKGTQPEHSLATDQPVNTSSSNPIPGDKSTELLAANIEAVNNWDCVSCGVSSDPQQISLALMRSTSPISSENANHQPTPNAGQKGLASQPRRWAAGAGASPHIRLGLVVGPDLSTAGSLSNFERPGYKLGVKADVFLGPRFAISTGIMHSNVRYTAGSSEYDFSSRYIADGIAVQETFAECAILEIPLTFRYNVKDFSQSGLFVSGGVSSYIMLNEHYQFTYEDRYNANGESVREWSTRSGRAHIFSNARISAGYEQALSNHLGVQIQPYLNIPLSGVGAGKVELYSVGMLFSFNYKLR